MPSHRAKDSATILDELADLGDSNLYINRQLSWLNFNWRVLREALDQRHPLLERVKFLAIFASNLDEFFMIRVSGLRNQLDAGVMEPAIDGMTPNEQLLAVRRELLQHLEELSDCWRTDLLPKLHATGIHVIEYPQLAPPQRAWLREYFARDIFPVLTPLAFDQSHPFPHISNLSLNLAVVVTDAEHGECFARVKVPDIFPRLIALPGEMNGDDEGVRSLTDRASSTFVWLEDVIAANIDMLFPGLKVNDAYAFRVTRNADLEIEEDEADDLLATIKERVEQRDFGSEVRLEVDKAMPEPIRNLLIKNMRIPSYLVYSVDTPLGMADLMTLTRINRHDLKDPPFSPAVPATLLIEENIFEAVRLRDVLLYHPYHSFAPVVDFIRQAAKDPQVLAIKQTLYRVGLNSPIIDALMEAREHGKQVAVLVELKARFDEENNIAWARALEQAGVHVVYGVLGLKTHCKMCLVVRRERNDLVRYVHMGTGNYNAVTARLYTDFGYFTCDPQIGADVSDLFNALTGYSRKDDYQRLLVAPGNMRLQLIDRIEREIDRQRAHGDGYIAFKMNALVDPDCIKALYLASQAGVKVDLQIRGICCLRPGIPGISETISVTSIIGRFLEHSRIYYFRNGGNEELLLGSADLMPRNLDRRVEILFPINDPHFKDAIINEILSVHLNDNIQSWRLLTNGEYERLRPGKDEPGLNSQLWMLEHAGRIE